MIARDLDADLSQEALWGLAYLVGAEQAKSISPDEREKQTNLACIAFLKVGQPNHTVPGVSGAPVSVENVDLTLITDAANPLVQVLIRCFVRQSRHRWVTLKIIAGLLQCTEPDVAEVCLQSGILKPLLAFLRLPHGTALSAWQREKREAVAAMQGNGDNMNGPMSTLLQDVVVYEVDGYRFDLASYTIPRMMQQRREVAFALANVAAGKPAQMLHLGQVRLTDPEAPQFSTYDGFCVLRDCALEGYRAAWESIVEENNSEKYSNTSTMIPLAQRPMADGILRKEVCFCFCNALAARRPEVAQLLVLKKDLWKVFAAYLNACRTPEKIRESRKQAARDGGAAGVPGLHNNPSSLISGTSLIAGGGGGNASGGNPSSPTGGGVAGARISVGAGEGTRDNSSSPKIQNAMLGVGMREGRLSSSPGGQQSKQVEDSTSAANLQNGRENEKTTAACLPDANLIRYMLECIEFVFDAIVYRRFKEAAAVYMTIQGFEEADLHKALDQLAKPETYFGHGLQRHADMARETGRLWSEVSDRAAALASRYQVLAGQLDVDFELARQSAAGAVGGGNR